MANEPTITEQSPIVALLNAAIAKGDTASIKTLAEIYERFEAKRAEREYNAALTAFQGECPRILKESTVAFPTRGGGNFSSRYAKLEAIVTAVRPLLQAHGFSYSFDTELQEKQVVAICRLHHVGGHSTSTPFVTPVDPAPKLSEAHAVASAVSFAQRYAFQLALGIVTGLPDDDGKAAFTGETISPAELTALQRLVDETKADVPSFWKFAGVERLADLPATKFQVVHIALVQRKQRQEAEALKEGGKP